MRRPPANRIRLAVALVGAALFCLASGGARAELLYRDWARLRGTDASAADRLLNAVGDALQWANAVLRVEDKPPLYCPPPGTVIALADYRDLLESAVAATGSENAAVVDVPILLLRGLRAAYPCEPPGRAVRAPLHGGDV